MSDTLVEFAEPLLSALPPGAGAKDWVDPLQVAKLVWNSLVVSFPKEELVTNLREGLGADFDVGGLVDELARRKASRFPNDRRFIVDFWTHEAEDRIHVTALSALSE